MAICPACGRAVARERASCLYCGSRLGPPPERPAAPPAAVPSRRLLLVDLGRSEPAALAKALSLSRYEAGLLTRRGGLHLVKAASDVEAALEAERLRDAGVGPLMVPESEVRERPVQCLAGEPRRDGLWLRSALGPLTLGPDSVFLVVSGPITREHQATDERRKILRARLDEGFRLHLHRREAAPALEIDANNFEVGFAVSGSVRLELEAWLDATLKGARRDTGFARLPPVLGPAEPDAKGGALAAAGSLAAASRADAERGALVLDNLAQFRFYSGCLAAVERRL